MLDVVKKAENVIENIVGQNNNNGRYQSRPGSQLPTTSQIRKFLSSVNVLLNKVNKEKREVLKEKKGSKENELLLSDKLAEEIKYLKINIAYDSGRDRKVKAFFEKAEMAKKVDEIDNSINKFEKFAKYVEALVAYHKFNGGI